MKVIEDGARPILDMGSCKDSNTILWKYRRKPGAALGIFEGTDTWCDYGVKSVSMVSIEHDTYVRQVSTNVGESHALAAQIGGRQQRLTMETVAVQPLRKPWLQLVRAHPSGDEISTASAMDRRHISYLCSIPSMSFSSSVSYYP